MSQTVAMIGQTRLMCAALLFAVCPVSVAISAYKCIDEDDAIYFSDKQCDTRQAQTVIGIKPAPPAVAQERVAIEARQARQQRIHEAEAEDREARREQRAEVLAQKKAMKQQRCDDEKLLLSKLQSQTYTRDRGRCFHSDHD
jgi:hypothetical protein